MTDGFSCNLTGIRASVNAVKHRTSWKTHRLTQLHCRILLQFIIVPIFCQQYPSIIGFIAGYPYPENNVTSWYAPLARTQSVNKNPYLLPWFQQAIIVCGAQGKTYSKCVDFQKFRNTISQTLLSFSHNGACVAGIEDEFIIRGVQIACELLWSRTRLRFLTFVWLWHPFENLDKLQRDAHVLIFNLRNVTPPLTHSMW